MIAGHNLTGRAVILKADAVWGARQELVSLASLFSFKSSWAMKSQAIYETEGPELRPWIKALKPSWKILVYYVEAVL